MEVKEHSQTDTAPLVTDVPQDINEPKDVNRNENETFGPSEFGERLTYKDEGCCIGWKDRYWAIIFYIHCFVMLFLAIFIPTDLQKQGVNFTAIANTLVNAGKKAQETVSNTGADDVLGKIMGRIVGIIIAQCVAGIIWGLVWLKVMQKFPKSIIKTMLFVKPLLFIILAIFFFSLDSKYNKFFAGVAGFFTFCFIIYAWCIWSRIPFSAALLKIASKITQSFPGTICISFLVIPINVIWALLWNWIALMVLIGYLLRIGRDVNNAFKNGTTYQPPMGEITGVFFLMMLSYFWVVQVAKNVAHCSTCGVAATWYFSTNVKNPTLPALKRTMTTSFGSVCFGSFIVAFIQALRATLRPLKKGPCRCIVCCFLWCLEKLIAYFNLYAYCQCAIYGVGFIQAAKATFSLFLAKGFSAIINDTITGLPLMAGGMIAFLLCFFTGFGLTFAAFSAELSDPLWGKVVPILAGYMAAYGGLMGYFACYSIFFPVQSSIMTLFVCFAEDPDALKATRPESYAELTSTNKSLYQYVELGHTGLDPEGKTLDGPAKTGPGKGKDQYNPPSNQQQL